MDRKVKKEMRTGIIGIALMICLSGCGSSTPKASDITINKDSDRATAILEKDAADIEPDMEKEADAIKDIGDASEEEAVEIAGTKKGIVFGSSEAAGYQDFNYLTEALISTSKTDSGEKKTFCVYIPKEERIRVSGASARSGGAGVYMKVDLEPYLQYQSENYSIRANLQKYVDGEIDYYESYQDVMVGNIQEIEDGAVCEVSYMEYDSYEDIYTPHYTVYSLYDLGDDVTALVTLSVNADNTTNETGKIIEELSSFYQMDISWDESFAQTRKENFENKYKNLYTVDCLAFNLPDGWEIDEDISDEYLTFFAPGGDMEEAGVCFVVSAVEEAYGMVEMFLEYMDDIQEAYEEELVTDERDFVEISDMGITFLGRTLMIELSFHDREIIEGLGGTYDEEMEGTGNITLYIAEDDNNMYMFYVCSVSEDEEELPGLSDEAQEALDLFFETGRVTESFM